MSANRKSDPRAKARWSVRVAMAAVERLTALEHDTGVQVGTWIDWALEGLAEGNESELRARLVARCAQPFTEQLAPWQFTVDAVTISRAQQVARELSVTQSKLITLVIDCLTQDDGDGGGNGRTRRAPGGRRMEVLRIIYSSATAPVPAEGGLSSAEASTA